MRLFFFVMVIILVSVRGFSQTEQLAKNYFDRGEFEKALTVYQTLVEEEPVNSSYFFGLIATLQQLEQFQNAEELLLEKINTTANAPHFLVELGHNYELQNKKETAQDFYKEALRAIESRPNYAFSIARTFEKYSLLNEAVSAYELGMKMNPDAQYSIQLARLYGEQGQIEKMFSSYLDVLGDNPDLLPGVSRVYGEFITDDPDHEVNRIFRNLLLRRLQEDQNILFNQMLSLLFIQQKEYEKAFLQEKAIYRRSQQGLGPIMRLPVLASEEGDTDTALEVLDFVIEETPQDEVKIQAYQMKMGILQETVSKEELPGLEKTYEELLVRFGKNSQTLSLQIDYANMIAFDLERPLDGEGILRNMLAEDLGKMDEAAVKMALADILLLSEKFNQALIFYTQVQNLLQNDAIAQTARFKVAKTSYYKGDFEWAAIQLNVLKSATSQLIANDAMELSLLISENTQEDSTNVPLKVYARADLLAFQGKDEQAIQVLDSILVHHKGRPMEDDALLMQALLLEKVGEFEKAEQNYLRLIQYYKNGILGDNAHYRLAELYANQLARPEKAREFYEKIVFNYADSIYFVDARQKFRKLRGDNLE